MAEELSAIDRYRAQWKMDKARIAELNSAFDAAHLAGDTELMRTLVDQLWAVMRMPRHLPIKRLTETPHEPI